MLIRALVVWLLIVAAEVVHGIARARWLEPRVGDLRARQIGVFTGSAMILAIALVFSRWIGARGSRQLLAVGLLWLSLMLGFEILVGHFAFGVSWERIASDYDPRRGGLLPIGMAILTLAPRAADGIRRLTVDSPGTRN
jgi:hypothetical protein